MSADTSLKSFLLKGGIGMSIWKLKKFKQFVCVSGVGAALLTLGAETARAEFIQSPAGYTVRVPQGWQVQHEWKPYHDRLGRGTDMMFAHPKNHWPMFRVEVDPQGKATMESVPTLFRMFVSTHFPSFRQADQTLCVLHGVETMQTRGWATFQGKNMWIDMLFTITNGKNYTITLLTPADKAKPSEAAYCKIITSLRWTKPTK